MVEYCTSLPNSLFNNITLVAWTQPWWVGIFTPENLVNTTKRSFTYRSFPHQTSCQTFTSNHCFAPQWAQDQGCRQLGVLLSSFTGVGKALQSSPKLCSAFPKPLCLDKFWHSHHSAVSQPSPCPDPCAFPHTHIHSHSQHTLLGVNSLNSSTILGNLRVC